MGLFSPSHLKGYFVYLESTVMGDIPLKQNKFNIFFSQSNYLDKMIFLFDYIFHVG